MGEIKNYKIIWSPSFKRKLKNICNYILVQLKEPTIAKKFYKGIKSKLYSLSYFPERNLKINIKDIEFRKLFYKNYVILYQVHFENQEVLILHIFHGNQDYLYHI